jgi:hypothetical protein
MRRRRFRTWAKWACTLLAAGLLLATTLSLWRHLFCWGIIGSHQIRLGFDRRVSYLTVEAPLRVGEYAGWGAAAQRSAGPRLINSYWRWPSQEMASPPQSYRMFATPFWAPLIALTLPIALISLDEALARRRKNLGLCPHRNYDRRGLPSEAKCPECGTIPVRAQSCETRRA